LEVIDAVEKSCIDRKVRFQVDAEVHGHGQHSQEREVLMCERRGRARLGKLEPDRSSEPLAANFAPQSIS
jgi:hypothetical protein